jgi:hypothetical protein
MIKRNIGMMFVGLSISTSAIASTADDIAEIITGCCCPGMKLSESNQFHPNNNQNRTLNHTVTGQVMARSTSYAPARSTSYAPARSTSYAPARENISSLATQGLYSNSIYEKYQILQQIKELEKYK